jgi:hypothetical protein
MDFTLGQAGFSNTGGCWVEIWGKRLLITNHWRRMNIRIHVHREGNEIVYRLNGEEQRIAITPQEAAKPTGIGVRFRSRTSLFRRIAIKADRQTLIEAAK